MKNPIPILLLLATSFAWGDQNATLIGKVIPSDADSQDHFGTAVAVWEDFSVVGAPNVGAVYVYREEDNGSMTQISKLTPSEGGSNTQFGGSVSLSDGIIAVGAKWSDQGGHSNSGAAYLYQVLPDGTLHYLHKVTAHDANATDCFGSSVSFSDGILAVGAPSDDHSGGNDAGSAYVYRLEHNGSLSPLDKLTASDANASHNFGHSVSTSYGLVAVGAPSHNQDGATYLYWQEENGSFLQIAKLLDPNANYAPGGDDGFGHAVSLAGDRLAVSTKGDDSASGSDSGAVYLFSIVEGTPHLLDEVLAPDGHANAHFGYSLSLSYDLMAVGASKHNHGGHNQAGAAYLYRIEDNGTAGLIEKFVADDANASDNFGSSVALSHDTLAVGAPKTDYWGNTDAGTVYYYDSWAAANRAPVDIRPDPFLGFGDEKEHLIHDLQTGWLKSAESLVFDAYGWTVDPSDDWNVTILEYENSTIPIEIGWGAGQNDVQELTIRFPVFHDYYSDLDTQRREIAREMGILLMHQNLYAHDVVGDTSNAGLWFLVGLTEFLVGADHLISLALGGQPTVSVIDGFLTLVGSGDAQPTGMDQVGAYLLAVRYLDFKIRQSGQTDGIKHMTSWMKAKYDLSAGPASSGINAYFSSHGALGYSDNLSFLNDFKGANGRNFIQNEIIPTLDNNDTGSVLGGDVTGGPNLDGHSVVPNLHGPPQSNVQYEIDEWANVLEFEEESPIGTVVGHFEAVDLDPHGTGWKGYELIEHGANISWSDAKAAADAADAADPFHRVYLATVTSEAEHNLTKALVAEAGLDAWLGGSDAAVEGEWRWTEGPEGEEGEEHSGQGLLFWLGGSNGSPANGLFTNWLSSDPNSHGGNEDNLKIRSEDKFWIDKGLGSANTSAYLLEFDQEFAHVFSLVSGPGDDHNHLFVLGDDGALHTAVEFDYENDLSSYSIRVRVTDELNASFEKIFFVDLLDIDEDPDRDGLHNNEDLDDDGDGYSDTEEIAANSDPRNAWSLPSVTKIIYVDADADGENNGTSWASAYDNLQAALAEADGVNRTQIWVAEGVYLPDVGPGQTEGDRNSTFQLKNRLEIIGGFYGDEQTFEERGLNGFITYLSGDIGAHHWPDDNAYHVVNAAGVDRTAKLIDLGIGRGRADGPTHLDRRGAGILALNGSPSLQNLAIFDNHAAGVNSGGGGLCVYNGGSPAVFSCIFQSNSADWGGAVKLSLGSSAVFYNALLFGNQADKGGAMFVWESNATITHSTLIDNNASNGGAFYAGSDANVSFYNSIAWDNHATQNPTGSINQSAFASDHSIVQGGQGDLPDADPLFVDPEMGDFRLRLGSPAVDAGNFDWVGALPLDYGGVNRTHDAGPDLGVYEGAVDAVNLGGNITYSGEVDTGPFRVWLMDQSGIKVKQLEMGTAGPYSFVVQRGLGYKVKAFRDAANDGWPSVGDPWDYHAHYPIEINESRSDFHVHLQDALPEQNATVSGEVFYEGPVPGPVVVWVLDGHSIVREQILPEGAGDYSFTLPKGEAYEILAFKDGNENGELDDQPQVGEPAAMYGVLNESSQTFESEVFVGGDLTDLDIEIFYHSDQDDDGITDWEEYIAGLNGGEVDPEPVEPDLVAEYLLDGDATDSSLNENHGFVFGAVPGENRFGEDGMALFFDGEDDHVLLPPMELGSEYSLSVWIQPEEEKGGGYFNVLSNNGDPVWGVREDNLKQYLFGRVEGSPVARHEWTHLVLIRDGATHKLYKNGELDATANFQAGNDVFSIIGAYLPGAEALDDREPFHGTIDDLIIWDRALTHDEAIELHDLETDDHGEGEEHEEVFVPIVRTGFHEEDGGDGYVFSGQILTDGGSPVLEVGIFLSESIMGDDLIWLPAELDPETQEFSVSFDELEPGVRYYYRAFARNAAGENLGSLRKLVTRDHAHPGAWWHGMPAVGEGWRVSEWFGAFRKFEQTNWIYHAKLDWVFAVPDEERGLWLWNRDLGWLWTQDGAWPYLWRNEVSGWIYFHKIQDGRSVIYDYGTSEYLILP